MVFLLEFTVRVLVCARASERWQRDGGRGAAGAGQHAMRRTSWDEAGPEWEPFGRRSRKRSNEKEKGKSATQPVKTQKFPPRARVHHSAAVTAGVRALWFCTVAPHRVLSRSTRHSCFEGYVTRAVRGYVHMDGESRKYRRTGCYIDRR